MPAIWDWRSWGWTSRRTLSVGLRKEPFRQLISLTRADISKIIALKMRMMDKGRTSWRWLACVFIAAFSASVFAQNTVVGKYNGPGGCASSSCHGSIQPKQITHVAQNEYSIWAGQDKHARAYQVLSNDVSVRIGKILNLKAPPNQNQKCLVCHALSVAPEMRAQTFDVSDGVSCEQCHGPAAGWLGPHTVNEWETRTGDQKAQLG